MTLVVTWYFYLCFFFQLLLTCNFCQVNGKTAQIKRAVKLLRNAASAEDKAEFTHEAETMLKLDHPNLVRTVLYHIWYHWTVVMFSHVVRLYLLLCDVVAAMLMFTFLLIFFKADLFGSLGDSFSILFSHKQWARRRCNDTSQSIL